MEKDKVYNPEIEIEELCKREKITYYKKHYEQIKAVGRLGLLHSELLNYINQGQRKQGIGKVLMIKGEVGNLPCEISDNKGEEDVVPKELTIEEIDKKKEKNQIKIEFLSLSKEKRWADATEILVDYILSELKLYTTKEDKHSETWVYKGGIYVPQGKSEVRELLRDLLGEWYSSFIFGKVMDKIEPDTFIEPRRFFQTNYINEIAVLNGILNLETLELTPFDSDKIFFNKIPVRFEPEKDCPSINKFLSEVLADEEDIKVFYELSGFALLGEYRYEKAFMFVGGGRNGKGKSIELLKRLVGVENCASIPLSSLEPESFAISELFQKRLNLAGDVGNKDLKDTSIFKSLTGRDLIGGKRKFLNNIYFQNFAKMVFACNELPMVYDLSRGFWERWVLMEFPYTFISKEEYENTEDKTFFRIKDERIIDKITTDEEMSGYLNQALIGLSRLRKNKEFSVTRGTEEIKNTWIRKSNSFIAFCMDNIEEDFQGKISKKELRVRYSQFCKEHKISGKSEVVIKRVLQEMFGAGEIQSDPFGTWKGERMWEGIRWKK